MNGKTVEVDNTDAEGRLVLAGNVPRLYILPLFTCWSDAIYYVSSEYKPHTLIDVATLTGYVPLSIPPLPRFGLITSLVPWTSRLETYTLVYSPHQISSGTNSASRERLNSIDSGVCHWTRIMVLRSIRRMLTYAT